MTMETSRRGFLGAALALAAAATVPGTAKALTEDDAAKLARLLSTPGSVIRGYEFHIHRDVPITELRDIAIENCKFYLYGDAEFLPAKCKNVNITWCNIQRVDGITPFRPVGGNTLWRARDWQQVQDATREARPGDVIDISRGVTMEPTVWHLHLG